MIYKYAIDPLAIARYTRPTWWAGETKGRDAAGRRVVTVTARESYMKGRFGSAPYLLRALECYSFADYCHFE